MAQIWSLDISLMAIIVLFTMLYCIAGVIYRLYLSPLAKFPGPKLAAATLWYEAYYDVVKKGQYTFKIRELHKKYGELMYTRAVTFTFLLFQDPSSASVPTSLTSMIQTSTNNYTRAALGGTSINTTQCKMEYPNRPLARWTIGFTDFVGNL
jgi:hypothetical protein